jgi:hypothetical protein
LSAVDIALSAVDIALSAVNIALSGANIPLSGANIAWSTVSHATVHETGTRDREKIATSGKDVAGWRGHD